MTANDFPGLESADEGCIRFLRFGQLPGVEVMDVRGVSRQWAYFHETYSFCAATWVADGRDVPWRYRQRTHVMNPVGVQLMEPGEFHSNLQVAPRANFRVLMLAPKLVCRLASDITGANRVPHLNRAQLAGGPVRAVLSKLTAVLAESGDVERCELGVHRLVEVLCSQGCLERGESVMLRERGRPAVRAARDLIHASWNEHLPLATIGRAAGLPIPTLERAFLETFGTSPRQYQNHLRLERGKELLKSGTPLAAAAQQVGFHDPKYFARCFKRQFGCAPSQYRLASTAK
jgi:AraC-like DNA-binding protein